MEDPITPDILLRAYSLGLFPMGVPMSETDLEWHRPTRRGIIPLSDFHLPRHLRKVIRRGVFRVRVNTDFGGVLAACARDGESTKKAIGDARHAGGDGFTNENVWINARIKRLYMALHERGHCHSVESYSDGVLVGGLYGVHLGAVFFGESMFSHVSDASKVALVHLVARLLSGNFRLLDTQFMTPHLRRFGGVEIGGARYASLLGDALGGLGDFHHFSADDDCATVLHLINQTS